MKANESAGRLVCTFADCASCFQTCCEFCCWISLAVACVDAFLSLPRAWDGCVGGKGWEARGKNANAYGWWPRDLEKLQSSSLYGLHRLSEEIRRSTTKQQCCEQAFGFVFHATRGKQYVCFICFCFFELLFKRTYNSSPHRGFLNDKPSIWTYLIAAALCPTLFFVFVAACHQQM